MISPKQVTILEWRHKSGGQVRCVGIGDRQEWSGQSNQDDKEADDEGDYRQRVGPRQATPKG
jgi:hypothetical protein